MQMCNTLFKFSTTIMAARRRELLHLNHFLKLLFESPNFDLNFFNLQLIINITVLPVFINGTFFHTYQL